jgi:hypothetical protein
MPVGSTRLNAVLSNLAVQYKNSEYISSQCLPSIPVTKESDYYWIWANDFRIPETVRANGARANMITVAYSTSAYQVSEHALKDVVTDRDRVNADPPINLEVDTTENLVDKILQRVDYETMKLFFTTTNWGGNATLVSTTSWKGHTTTASPSQHVLSAAAYVRQNSGKVLNTMVIGSAVFDALKENQNIWERIKYSERAIVTKDLLAAYFDIGSIHIGGAIYDTTKEGETASISDLWGSDCFLAYMEPSPGIKKASAAYNFRVAWKGNPYRVKKWREEDIEGDYIEVQTMCAPRAVATACAYLYKAVAL